MPTIDTLSQGSTPTLLQAEKGNELIGYVNSLMSSEGEDPINVEVDTDGKMTISLGATSSVEIDYVDANNEAAIGTFILIGSEEI